MLTLGFGPLVLNTQNSCRFVLVAGQKITFDTTSDGEYDFDQDCESEDETGVGHLVRIGRGRRGMARPVQASSECAPLFNIVCGVLTGVVRIITYVQMYERVSFVIRIVPVCVGPPHPLTPFPPPFSVKS